MASRCGSLLLSLSADALSLDDVIAGHHPYYWGGGAAGLARHLMNEPDLKDVLEIGAVNTETNAKQQAQNRVSAAPPHLTIALRSNTVRTNRAVLI